MRPLFSIITVTRNAADTLPTTLKSVAEQTCDLYELIVVDGASTDSTVQIAREAPISSKRIISEPDSGIYDAMNKGLSMAQGDYVIFLNAGDAFYCADTLQQIADTAMNEDYPGIIYGDTVIVDASGHELGPRHLTPPDTLTVKSFSQGMLICHQAFVALRKITDFFDTRYRFSSDYDWCVRVIQRSRRNHYLHRNLVRYLNEGMTTRNHRRSLMERYRIMCRYYGWLPTTLRHIGFLQRFMKRKSKGK